MEVIPERPPLLDPRPHVSGPETRHGKGDVIPCLGIDDEPLAGGIEFTRVKGDAVDVIGEAKQNQVVLALQFRQGVNLERRLEYFDSVTELVEQANLLRKG